MPLSPLRDAWPALRRPKAASRARRAWKDGRSSGGLKTDRLSPLAFGLRPSEFRVRHSALPPTFGKAGRYLTRSANRATAWAIRSSMVSSQAIAGRPYTEKAPAS